jgi:hypothetical protein
MREDRFLVDGDVYQRVDSFRPLDLGGDDDDEQPAPPARPAAAATEDDNDTD